MSEINERALKTRTVKRRRGGAWKGLWCGAEVLLVHAKLLINFSDDEARFDEIKALVYTGVGITKVRIDLHGCDVYHSETKKKQPPHCRRVSYLLGRQVSMSGCQRPVNRFGYIWAKHN